MGGRLVSGLSFSIIGEEDCDACTRRRLVPVAVDALRVVVRVLVLVLPRVDEEVVVAEVIEVVEEEEENVAG